VAGFDQRLLTVMPFDGLFFDGTAPRIKGCIGFKSSFISSRSLSPPTTPSFRFHVISFYFIQPKSLSSIHPWIRKIEMLNCVRTVGNTMRKIADSDREREREKEKND
jgi:hypothetical protein